MYNALPIAIKLFFQNRRSNNLGIGQQLKTRRWERFHRLADAQDASEIIFQGLLKWLTPY
jgi:hypothetical protein